MPYIVPLDRPRIDAVIDDLPNNMTPGDLNYAITRILNKELRQHGTSYAEINELVGVLECVKQEFYRRVAVPYEDKKRDLNGDAYDAQQ